MTHEHGTITLAGLANNYAVHIEYPVIIPALPHPHAHAQLDLPHIMSVHEHDILARRQAQYYKVTAVRRLATQGVIHTLYNKGAYVIPKELHYGGLTAELALNQLALDLQFFLAPAGLTDKIQFTPDFSEVSFHDDTSWHKYQDYLALQLK